jgi:hypothetical protein
MICPLLAGTNTATVTGRERFHAIVNFAANRSPTI